MRKQQFAIVLIVICFMLFGGCYSAIPDMTEEEEKRITQYMAELLLEHDANYQSTYFSADEKAEALAKEDALRQKAEQIRQEEEKIRQEKSEANKPEDIEVSSGVSDVEGSMSSLNEYLGFDSLQIRYLGNVICSRYPESDEIASFALTPTDGNEFIVLKFSLENSSGADFLTDMTGQGNYFVLRINESVQIRALTTLLEEDLSIYSNTLAAGASDDAVLVFEKPLDLKTESLALEVRSLSRDIYKKIPLEE